AGLLVACRVDQGGDVPAGGQDEPGLASEQLAAAVTGLPGADVVGHAGDRVAVSVDLGQVCLDAEHGDPAGLGQRVGHGAADEVAVQGGGHPRGVGVPVQDVEGRRLTALQVVVHPVVPDQVTGAQPGEDLGQLAPVQVALAGGGGDRRLRCRLV